jgi:regulatory protein
MKLSPDHAEILKKIRHFCSFQERCTREVQDRLKSWAVQRQNIPGIIRQMQEEGFLDDARFARVFAGGKFRHNKWGKQKIEFELKMRGIPERFIAQGLDEIEEEEYKEVLSALIRKKYAELNPEKNLNIREKIITFAYGKGFEISLVHELIKELHI